MTEEKKAKLDELNQKKAELEKARDEETNGQKKGGITRSLNAVIKEIEALEAESSETSTGSENGTKQDDPSAAGSGTDSEESGDQSQDAAGDSSKDENSTEEEERIPVTVRSKTGQRYRRIGIIFRNEALPFKVTAQELKALKADPWLEVKEA